LKVNKVYLINQSIFGNIAVLSRKYKRTIVLPTVVTSIFYGKVAKLGSKAGNFLSGKREGGERKREKDQTWSGHREFLIWREGWREIWVG
jgi:hypothetical protein